MKHKNALVLFASSGLLLAGAALWHLSRQTPVGVSASFAGCHPSRDSTIAVAVLSNHTAHPIHCTGNMFARCGPAQNQLPFNLTLHPGSTSVVTVNIPPQPGPGIAGCQLDIVGQHVPWVRWAGDLLDTIGVHIYHVQPSIHSHLAIKFGGRKVRPAPATRPITAILPLPHAVTFTPVATTPPVPVAPFPLSSSLTLYSITNQWTLP